MIESRKGRGIRARPQAIPSRGARFAVFTALEGVLLDCETLDAGPTRAVLRRLQSAGIPVVPSTVMTLAEVEPIAADLGLRSTMIIEAGNAILRPAGDGWDVEPFGLPSDAFLDVIRDIEDRSNASLLVYSALSPAEAALLSGRSGTMLAASQNREFSEPFIIESGELESVVRAAAALGFSLLRDGRFLHLTREGDDGGAFARLREELRCDVAVAVGGTPIDAGCMARAEIPVIVPGPDGRPDPELLAMVPGARLAPAPGPAGWAAAVEKIWKDLGHPPARASRSAIEPISKRRPSC